MPFTQKLKSGPMVWQKLHIFFCHPGVSTISKFGIKTLHHCPTLCFLSASAQAKVSNQSPRQWAFCGLQLAPNHCTVYFASSWVLENYVNLSQWGSERNHLFPGAMASKKHFWTGTVVTKPAHISSQSSQSSCWENLTPLRSVRAHSFSPKPFNSTRWKEHTKPEMVPHFLSLRGLGL